MGVGGVVSICLGVGEGGPLWCAPARFPFSTSSSSSISIYLPALLLYLFILLYHLLLLPTPTFPTHHPQLNGWLTQGLLGYMLRVFPTHTTHTHTHRHVCVCARAKMVGPTSHLRFKHLLLPCPLVLLASNSPAAPPLSFRSTYT